MAPAIARETLRRELAVKSAELDGVLRALPDIYFRLDGDGRILAWRAQSEGELHVPPDSFLGRRPQDVVPPDVGVIIAAAIARVRAEQRLVVVEYALPTPSGDDQFEARLVPSHGDEIVVLIRNITGRRRAEVALRASEERLRASQKMEALGRLAGGVAHDFNNLLTVMVGRLQLLERTAMADAARAHVREALDAAGRASSLTRQLLTLSRRQVMQPAVVELNEVVAEMQVLLQRLVGEHVEFAAALDEKAAPVRIEKSQLEQVLLNLVVNARDAMPDGGALAISTRDAILDEENARHRDGARPGRFVVLTVTDTGCGITPDVMGHLFEPFFTTKPRGQGTGLGLATVYGIVKQGGGHLVVRSAVGVGSTFEAWLPASEIGPTSSPSPSPPPVVEPTLGPRTILVVEDAQALRKMIAEILAEAGYAVQVAADSREALQALLAQRPPIELLLTDVVMPGMNGRALAARVTEAQPEIRVLLMSGHDALAADTDDAAPPAWPLLEKPFTPEALLLRVRDVLSTPAIKRRSG